MNTGSHRARKRFGQNFLQDEAIIQRIVQCINPSASDALVEIGPGLGALTYPLLQHVDSLTALELDRDLHQRLEAASRRPGHGTLTVHSVDALKVNFNELAANLATKLATRPMSATSAHPVTESASESLAPESPDPKSPTSGTSTSGTSTSGAVLRVVGNLPYNISTPLLFHLLMFKRSIRDMHFMLQQEVVDRITASPGTKTYGRLSVMMQTYCDTEQLMSVPPEAFDPQPAVQSAIVRLTPYTASSQPGFRAPNFASLETTVKLAFAQRRKTLRNNFKGVLTDTDFEHCGINPGARAETLDLPAFVKLASQMEIGLPSPSTQ